MVTNPVGRSQSATSVVGLPNALARSKQLQIAYSLVGKVESGTDSFASGKMDTNHVCRDAERARGAGQVVVCRGINFLSYPSAGAAVSGSSL